MTPELDLIVTRYLARHRRLARRPPVIELRALRRHDQRLRGWASSHPRRIVVYRRGWWSAIDDPITLLHELVHLSGMPGTWQHRAGFRPALARGAGVVWGIELDGDAYRSVPAWRTRSGGPWWSVRPARARSGSWTTCGTRGVPRGLR